jgi:thiamine-monophosphate kinase
VSADQGSSARPFHSEDELIEAIAALSRAHGPSCSQPGAADVVVGIGDDAAVLSPRPGRCLVLETDDAEEGVHFRLDWMAPQDAGHRLATQGLSDLAAMAAEPRFALLNLAVPKGTARETVEGFSAGLIQQLGRFGVALVGGNVCRATGGLRATITIAGETEPGRAALRTGARAGDRLYVTGPLGWARAGWTLLEQGLADRPGLEALVAAYRRPEPRIRQSRVIREKVPERLAMIDVTDGLARDLRRLLPTGGGARLDAARFPGLSALEPAAHLLGVSAIDLALAGGDDFELLFTAPPARELPSWAWPIGEITAEPGLGIYGPQGARIDVTARGYDHLR